MTPPAEPAGCDDWELAARARNGDEGAYAALIARHQGAIHAFVRRSVESEETARDIAQEVFVRAWFALERARPAARFTTWLFQIAVNLCRDHAKSKAARQSRITDSFVRNTADEREFPHPGPAPDRQAQTSEMVAVLEAEIRRLPVELREAFLLGAVDGEPHREIAAVLGASPKAVEMRIHRARRILGERLAALGIVKG